MNRANISYVVKQYVAENRISPLILIFRKVSDETGCYEILNSGLKYGCGIGSTASKVPAKFRRNCMDN